MNMKQIEKLNEGKSAIEKMNMTHLSIMEKKDMQELADALNDGKISYVELVRKMGKSISGYIFKLAEDKAIRII